MMRLVFAFTLIGCSTRVIDLGRDATVDTKAPMPDATSCRCRITSCRVAADCAMIGGACGPDFYCVGDFGPCTTDTQCQATNPNGLCTKTTDSTTPCP